MKTYEQAIEMAAKYNNYFVNQESENESEKTYTWAQFVAVCEAIEDIYGVPFNTVIDDAEKAAKANR